MKTAHRTISVCACAIALALTGSACTPGATQGGTGPGSEYEYDTFAISGVTTYPYGDTYTAPARLTSEASILIDYTDAPIRITYSVKSYTIGTGASSYYTTHDLGQTPFLDTGDNYQHRGDYLTYDEQGEFDMRGRGISCQYRDGEPCTIDRNEPETFKFTIIEGFAEQLDRLRNVRVDER
ncbi:MAG TPA: hypothetical protein VIG64_03115 [Actinomycetota bacterium]